ncbi:MAG: IS66 family insertion sequence element accessory protein TnpB [Alcanivoracaceae bacterium]|nr:IS66 family insertion sequence element accessory protein TnpB [Alcanivoracaceae bacterium]
MLKIVYWQETGFCMWQVRLEKDKFKWPINNIDKVICWDKVCFSMFLKGMGDSKSTLHKPLVYTYI